MSTAALAWSQFRFERRNFWRNPSAAFFNFMLPLIFLVLIATVYGAKDSDLDILVLYGEHDDGWPPELQAEMARRLDAECVVIPGAVHSPAVEAPETTAHALTRFWNTAEARMIQRG